MQFLQIASNPSLAPFAKFQYVISEIAKSMDLDPDKVTNNMSEAALQAELMKQFQAPPEQQQEQQQGQATGAPLDPTGAGGGTIGTGQAPVPGEQGFSGNVQQGTGTQPPQATGEQQPPVGSIQ